ncbi:Uncharacterised protein [uncultured archaeon]|nr:Uncharacterised protein [uncultured archaeon]
MFKKNKCHNCKSRVNEKYDFCPHCGSPINGKAKEDFGMLGKNDMQEQNPLADPFFGGMLGGGMLNKMLNNTMKMLEKELQRDMKEAQNMPAGKTNFELYINGKKIDPSKIKVTQVQEQAQAQESKESKKQKEQLVTAFNKDQMKKFSELPRIEPQTSSVRRFSNRVIYEIDLPEVKSVQDVAITKLENSIEIKAVGKTKSYFKVINVGLPIAGYELEEGKLILELGTKD